MEVDPRWRRLSFLSLSGEVLPSHQEENISRERERREGAIEAAKRIFQLFAAAEITYEITPSFAAVAAPRLELSFHWRTAPRDEGVFLLPLSPSLEYIIHQLIP